MADCGDEGRRPDLSAESMIDSLRAEAASLAEQAAAKAAALAAAAARYDSLRATAVANVAAAADLRFKEIAGESARSLGREEVRAILALRGLPCYPSDVDVAMALMGANADALVAKEAYLPLHSALVKAGRSTSLALPGQSGPPPTSTLADAFDRGPLWEAKLREIASAEKRHVVLMKSERLFGWEPARDDALEKALEKVRCALPAPPSPLPGERPHLDPVRSSRLLGGRCGPDDVANIKRLAKSSVWLFSSSTFKASVS